MNPTPKSPSTMTYADMKLSPAVQKSLQTMKFENPTPIQAKAIPVALMGKDILGCAQTGTGKTAAFGIPLVESLIQDPNSMAVILAPTRELAQQIIEVLRKLAANVAHTQSVLLIGGASMRDQFQALRRNPRIVVATPGRLMDHLRRKSINLGRVKTLVLDEADRMLDMGFAPQLEEILEFLPTERQTFLFSATLPANIKSLAKKYLSEPESITIGSVSTPVANIKHEIIQTTIKEKNDLLLDQLNKREGSVLIFTKTKIKADDVADYLADYGFSTGRIHGDRSQGQRNMTIRAFREQKFRILVATDIAARGLDVPHIQHVINYDLPQVPEDYVHRIGRTARAGATGEAVAFVVPQDRGLWMRIARMNPAWKLQSGAGRGAGGSERSRGEFSSDRGNRNVRPRTGDSPYGDREGRGSFKARPDRAATSGRSERPERSERTERSARFERDETSPRFERQQSARPARGERNFEGSKQVRSAKPRDERSSKTDTRGGVRKFQDERSFRDRKNNVEAKPTPKVRENLLETMGFDVNADKPKRAKKKDPFASPYAPKKPGKHFKKFGDRKERNFSR